jgi:uncharacterized protein YndB with AHSA1/START domain
VNVARELAVRRAIRVERDLESAFRIFTEGMERWWTAPGATNRASLEPRLGGRFSERLSDGRENTGEVLVWEPPSRVVFTWRRHANPDVPLEVDVRFRTDGAGTLVELEHRGFERLGAEAAEIRAGYDEGWPAVLARYARFLTTA